MKRTVYELLRGVVTIVMVLLILFAASVAQSETRYYILGNRDVVKTYSPDAVGDDKIIIIDCRQKNPSDQIGCIIAASYQKEKKKIKLSHK